MLTCRYYMMVTLFIIYIELMQLITKIAHPICALKAKSGWTRRIYRCDDIVIGGMQWDMFCPPHAASVKDPVKPKAKRAISHVDEDALEEVIVLTKPRTSISRPSKGATEDFRRLPTISACPEDIANVMSLITHEIADEMVKNVEAQRRQHHRASDASVYTMSEWPGQNEGEAMDLEHFWNYVSMMFPEDHSPEWVAAVYKGVNSSFPMNEKLSGLTGFGKPTDPMEEVIISEKDRQAAFLIEKRSELLYSIVDNIKRIDAQGVMTTPSPAEDGLFPLVDYNDFLIVSRHVTELHPFEVVESLRKARLRVLFDSDCRREISYTIEAHDDNGYSGKSDIIDLSHADLEAPTSDLILGSSVASYPTVVVTTPFKLRLNLENTSVVDINDTIHLWDKELIPRSKYDILNMMIKTDQNIYRQSLDISKALLSPLATQSLSELASSHEKERAEWNAIETLYKRQRIWKKVGSLAALGMRDLTPEGSIPVENIPASWAIQVDGRPKASDVDGPVDDAICSVCFDGSSSDTNSILFCDGCNASLHQACYGISEVPEGDFYCDRCRAIQNIADDVAADFQAISHGRDAVTCCMCTSYHGGLKPTTDGRWAHLCCTLWSQTAIIKDLDEMGPIDVSEVFLQRFQLNKERRRCEQVTEDVDVGGPITDICRICNIMGGFVMHCSGGDGFEDPVCDYVFHPICAWFEGLYIVTKVTDPTYQGIHRGGIFPSGLSYSFKCLTHTHPDLAIASIRQQQQTLRRRYKLDERDLDYVPGQRRSKKKKSQRAAQITAPRPTNVVKKTVAKTLNPDIYDVFTCAACLCQIPDYPFPLMPDIPPADTMSCVGCKIAIHASCYDSDPTFIPPETWQCRPCMANETDVSCMVCPRRGGYFVPTTDGWVHDLCSRRLPCPRRLSPDGAIELRGVPKDNKKQKCACCNRKTGVSLRCSALGCEVFFHALCAERSGKIHVRNVRGDMVAYCGEHIPPGLSRIAQGYWADLIELGFMSSSLDRARILIDLSRKRDKNKRNMYKTESDMHGLNFNRLLDKAMGRKGSDMLSSPDKDGDDFFGEDEDEDDKLDLDEEFGIPTRKISKTGNSTKVDGIISADNGGTSIKITKDGIDMEISSTWFSLDEIKVPGKVLIKIAGAEIKQKDTAHSGTKDFKGWLYQKMSKAFEKSNYDNSLFMRLEDLLVIEKALGKEVTEAKKITEFSKFITVMEGKGVKVRQPSRKVKRGYSVMQEYEEGFVEETKSDVIIGSRRKAVAKDNKDVLDTMDEKASMENASGVVVSSSSRRAKRDEEAEAAVADSGMSTALIELVNALPAGFENIFSIEENADWMMAGERGTLVTLERRLQYVINRVGDHEVPAVPNVKKFNKRKAASSADKRLASEEFQDIPYDLVPHYDSLVRRPLCISIMQRNLQEHQYLSFASFALDFYELLTNARFITDVESQVCTFQLPCVAPFISEHMHT
jgi:hypothetical protein